MKIPSWFNQNRFTSSVRVASAVTLISAAAAMAFVAVRPSTAAAPRYDINTLAGKVASLRGTAGLQIRFSAFLEQEAEEPEGVPAAGSVTPIHVLSSPLDGTTIVPPNVLVTQDTAAAPQNETAIAVDRNNPNRIVGGANDYVTRTWSRFGGGTPCSALSDGYSGTFDGGGTLSWSPPTFINQTTSPSTLNDKEWIAVDSHSGSPFQDRIYVSWTRFIFNPHNGSYVQSPIFFVYSTDGGATFSTPKNISANAHYSQGSHPVVGPDGTVYVFWDGSTRLASLNSTYMAKSTDG